MRKNILITLLILAAVSLGGYWLFKNTDQRRDGLYLYGNVDVRQVDVSFRVAGQIEKLFVEEGDLVKQGQLLAFLDKSPYDKQLAEAQANRSVIAVNYANAEKILKRRMELFESLSVSQEDLENAETQAGQLKDSLKQADAAVAIAQDNLHYTSAFAPVDGVILTRIREPGTVVNPADPVYTVSITDPVWIRAYVDEPNLGKVYYGMPAEVLTDTPGGKIYHGKVGFISPVAEFTPKTVQTTQLRTDLVYRLRIYVDNPDQGLLQGMPVTVKLSSHAP